jgi:xanthine dehydrogenase YagS FAD-binding subunit
MAEHLQQKLAVAMSDLTYHRVSSAGEAHGALQATGAVPMGGGTDLIPLRREHRIFGGELVDLRGLPGSGDITWNPDGSLTIGATVTLARIAREARIRSDFAALAEACASVGTHQLRTMGTLGGNLCQRPRCWYFRHNFECLRHGGSKCSAEEGENQYHAIFRTGPCVAVHPSDPAVALLALEARVQVSGPTGNRQLAMHDFFAPSRVRLDRETVLADDELVTAVHIPAHSSGGVQFYNKAMQRGVWDFALVALAGVKRTDGEVRLVLGGVAGMPWRVTDSIEEDVASGNLSEDDIETLSQRALYDATPLAKNEYKVMLATSLLQRGIARLSAIPDAES